jgi:hypothetical protein
MGVSRAAVVYKKANVSCVSSSTGNMAGAIHMMVAVNGKKYCKKKLVIQ